MAEDTHLSLLMSGPQAGPAVLRDSQGTGRQALADGLSAGSELEEPWLAWEHAGAPSQLQSPQSVFEAARKPSPCD